jgi:DNA-binding CsgD family transcriptional regulator
VFSGRWDASTTAAAEAVRLARATEQHELVPLTLIWSAVVPALRGQREACTAQVEQATATASRLSKGLVDDISLWVRGLLDLGAQDHEAALRRMAGIRHPLVALFASLDRVEAAALAGDRATAAAWLADLQRHADALGRPWTLARAAHGRALLAQGTAAEHAFTEALHHHTAATRPFEHARTHLAYGETLRRARRRADARTPLRTALDTFDQLGATPWADRARTELRACGHTVRRRDDPRTDQLTPQEMHVARFVADGLTNADVAARLFLSRRTVDFHLRNVFTKLGITSRTELVRFVLDPTHR